MKVALDKKSLQQLASLLNTTQKAADPTFGQLVRAVAFRNKCHFGTAADLAAFKSLTTSSGSGATLVPEIQANEIVSLLSTGGVLRKSGAKILPCADVRKFDIPVETGAVNVQYLGENVASAGTDDPSFAQRTHVTKDLRALFYASNNLARTSAPIFDGVVRDLAAKSVARAEDASFFAGMAGGPTAVTSIAGTTVINQIGGSLSYSDLLAVLTAAGNSEGPLEDFAWYVNATVLFSKILALKDTNGHPILKLEVGENGSVGKLLGFPVYVTPTIPNHIGSGSATSYILFTFPQNIQIADGQMQLDLARHFRFEFDQTAVRIVAPRDFSLGQPAAAILLENVI